jgi:hypothetical protein
MAYNQGLGVDQTMKCIKCGQNVIGVLSGTHTTGYQCVNELCTEYNQPWSLADHKDNQDWAVRHIRALEAQLKEQQEAIDLLLQRLGV